MRSYIECAEEIMNFYDFNGNQGQSSGGFEDKFAAYSQKSEDELTAQLIEVAKRMKAEGTFNPQSLENLYNTAYPMLNDEQRRRMRDIIDALKA